MMSWHLFCPGMRMITHRRLRVQSPLIVAVLLSIQVLIGCGPAARLMEPEPDWIFLGQHTATHLRENDVFKIRSKDKFAAIKLYVYNRGISVKRVEITLVNGDVLTPALDSHIAAGDRTRTIELSADGR